MNTHVQQAGRDLDFNEAWAYISLRERDRIRTKADLARAEFLIDLFARAGNALTEQVAETKERVVAALAAWFSHSQDRTFL